MRPEIQASFEAMEQQRTALANALSSLCEAQLTWTSPGSAQETWSIRQQVEHLVLIEETMIRPQTGPRREEFPFRLIPRALRRWLGRLAFARNWKLPLPTPEVDPSGNIPLAELLARWETARAEMRRFLETQQGNETPYFHPILGPFTAVQMMETGLAHTAYHERRIKALQRETSFPAGMT